MKSLTLEEKIVIFETLRLSKKNFQSLMITVQKLIVNELEETQEA